jgi:hypothetical protein
MASISDYRDSLQTWRDAGLITDEQANNITRFEEERARRDGPQIPAIVEVLIYLGVSAVVGSIIALMSNAWETLTSPARAVTLVIGAALGGAGGMLLRREGNTPLTRASTVLWVVSVGFMWGAGAVLAADTDTTGSIGGRILLAGAPATALAVAYYGFERRALLFLAAIGSVIAEVFAAQDAIGTQQTTTSAGLLLVAVGVLTWVILEGGVIRPRWVGDLTASALVTIGFFTCSAAGSGTWAEFVGLGVAGGMLWLSIQRHSTELLAVGSIALFSFITKIIFEHLADSLGAPLALLLTGVALIGVAIMMTRLRAKTR